MSFEIKRPKKEISRPGKVYVYKPQAVTLPLTINGEDRYVKVNPTSLPAGTAMTAPENVQVIFWEDAMYIYWEAANGYIELYEVDVSEEVVGGDTLTAETLDLNVTLDDAEYGLEQGVEYSVVVAFINSLGQSISASAVKGTLVNKTPQGLSVVGGDADNVNFSWDDIVGYFNYYKLYIKNLSSGVVEQEVIDIQNSNYVADSFESQEEYEAWVTAISDLQVFESGDSNRVKFTFPVLFTIILSESDVNDIIVHSESTQVILSESDVNGRTIHTESIQVTTTESDVNDIIT